MPELDGLAALPLIRQRSPRTRLVSWSGHPADRMAAAARAAGADAYLEKPTTGAALEALMQRWFAGRCAGGAG